MSVATWDSSYALQAQCTLICCTLIMIAQTFKAVIRKLKLSKLQQELSIARRECERIEAQIEEDEKRRYLELYELSKEIWDAEIALMDRDLAMHDLVIESWNIVIEYSEYRIAKSEEITKMMVAYVLEHRETLGDIGENILYILADDDAS